MLELDSLTHQYGTEVAVDDVSFGVEAGELVALLGPSGCGKTTIVQAIAGHIQPTGGQIRLRDTAVTNAPPETRQVSIVFQQSTLYPHMTVSENVAYGLKPQAVDQAHRERIVEESLELVDLTDQRGAYPSELSGGQQRRVELARAVAPQPDVLLLDEPLAALDRTLRERLREEIARIQRETGVTTLFVTHDQEEAMGLADRLVVMDDGAVSAIGTPRQLYESPTTPFVASFLGRSNTLPAIVGTHQSLSLELGGTEIVLRGSTTERPEGTDVTCYMRPADLTLHPAAVTEPPTSISLDGEIARIADLGRRYDVTVRLETGTELVVEHPERPPPVGDAVRVSLPPEKLTVFDVDSGERLA